MCFCKDASPALYETAFSGENKRMNIRSCFGAGLAVWLLSAAGLFAGGSGLNVVVVVNQNSTNSVQLGNYYCERRGVPPQNFLRITNWTGGNVEWTTSDFTNSLVNPLLSMLSTRTITNQIDYIVLSMDFPYRVVQTGAPSGNNSTTAALFYGFKADDPTAPVPAVRCLAHCRQPVPTPMPAAKASFARHHPQLPAAIRGW